MFLEGLTSGLFLRPHHGQGLLGVREKTLIYVVYHLQVFLVHELSPIDSGWVSCVLPACFFYPASTWMIKSIFILTWENDSPQGRHSLCLRCLLSLLSRLKDRSSFRCTSRDASQGVLSSDRPRDLAGTSQSRTRVLNLDRLQEEKAWGALACTPIGNPFQRNLSLRLITPFTPLKPENRVLGGAC